MISHVVFFLTSLLLFLPNLSQAENAKASAHARLHGHHNHALVHAHAHTHGNTHNDGAHALAAHTLEPRRIPASFDALQWDSSRRNQFQEDHQRTVTDNTPAEPLTLTVDVEVSSGASDLVFVTVISTAFVIPTAAATTPSPVSFTSQALSNTQLLPTTGPFASAEQAFTAAISSDVAAAKLLVSASSGSASMSATVSDDTKSHHSHSHTHTHTHTHTHLSLHDAEGPHKSDTTTTSTLASTTSTLASPTSTSLTSAVDETSTSQSSSVHPTTSSTSSELASSPKSSTSQTIVLHTSTSQSSTLQTATLAQTTSHSSTLQQTSTPTVTHPATMVVPDATWSLIHGRATSIAAQGWLDVPDNSLGAPAIPSSLAEGGMNGDVETNFGLFEGTGLLTVNSSNEANITNFDTVPYMSRDGGHGGVINGHKIFCFADTQTFKAPSPDKDGNWTGMVSNSMALDVGNAPFDGQPLVLQDPIGAFSGAGGGQRGAIPMTVGEEGFNWMNNYKKRYAIWPWGSFVPLNNDTSLLYAPIIYVDGKQFTNAGVTLNSISVTSEGYPSLERSVPLLFPETISQFGAFGGIRSWGPTGIGGMDGKVYLFGAKDASLLLARTDPTNVNEYDQYEYWNNATTPSSWTTDPTAATPFLELNLSSGDIFYSPRHGTFIVVFQTVDCQSNFYYSYLKTPSFIAPSYNAATWEDIVENIYQYEWSEQILLIDTPEVSPGHYTYDGGVLQGYFDEMDITNGGDRMLLHWTAPTSYDAGSMENGYQFWTAEIRWT